MVSSYCSAGPSPRIKKSFPLLSKSTDELILPPKIMISFPKPLSVNKNYERESNSIP